MHEDLADALQPALVRWTMGGAAAPLAPDGLREKLGDDPEEAELRLLAIAGQALGLLVVPEPAGDLQGLPDVPVLPLPTMPDRLRPLAARVLSRNDEWLRMALLRLVEARGFVVHPSDWMPGRGGDVPAVYAPWQDWLAGVEPTNGAARLPGERWDDLGPAGRRNLLKEMRRTDPASARALLAQRMAGMSAEHRLTMVAVLSTGLSEADRSFLEGLSADRAPTVRTLALRLLSRLGAAVAAVPDGEDPARDAGDFMRVEIKGVLRRQRVVTPVPTRNHAQYARRATMMTSIDLRRLSSALGVEDVELPAMWTWGADPALDQHLAAMILATGSDEAVAAFGHAVAAGAQVELHGLADDAARLSPDVLSTLAGRAYATTTRVQTLAASLVVPGVVDDHAGSPAWRSVMAEVRSEQGVRAGAAAQELLSLGVILTREAAARALDALAAAGMPSADPRLDTLRLNAAL